MKAKLIKKDEHYFLEVEPYTLSTLQRHTIIANTFDKPKGHILQLSKQNCDEIFGLVDVIDIVYKQVRNGFDGVIDSFTEAFAKECINKAVELNGDKVFTEDDVITAIVHYTYLLHNDGKGYEEGDNNDYRIECVIAALKQKPTEIEVEIEMECLDPNCDGIDKKGVCIPGNKPKLDSQECLILKHVV
jgi:hypothetical protein